MALWICMVPDCMHQNDKCQIFKSTPATRDQWKSALYEQYPDSNFEQDRLMICKCHFEHTQLRQEANGLHVLLDKTLDLSSIAQKYAKALNLIEHLESVIARKDSEMQKLRASLSKYLSEDQMEYMKSERPIETCVKWAVNTKMKAMNLYSRVSNSTYEYIRKNFIPLPSPTTMKVTLQRIPIVPGLQISLIKSLPKLGKPTPCALLLDETAIKDRIQIDRTFDTLSGFTSNEFGAGDKATHVLAFMMKGLVVNQKAVVAYYLTSNRVRQDDLAAVTSDVMRALEDHSDYRVTMMISDMGPNNQKLWNAFGVIHSRDNVKTRVKIPAINRDIIVIPDLSHLVKNLRNYFVDRKDAIKFSTEVINKFDYNSDVVSVETFDAIAAAKKNNPTCFDSTLTQNVIHPSHLFKMKVNFAERLFTKQQTIADIRQLIQNNKSLDPELVNKSRTLIKFIDLFASFYAIATNRNQAVAYNSDEYRRLEKIFMAMSFLVKGLKASDGKWKPWQTGILMFIDGIFQLFELLNKDSENVIEILIGILNSDAIESLFSLLKARNPHPTALDANIVFKQMAASLLSSNALRGNTEPDTASHLLQLPYFEKSTVDIPYEFTDNPDEFLSNMGIFDRVASIQKIILEQYHCQRCSAYFQDHQIPMNLDIDAEKQDRCHFYIFNLICLLEASLKNNLVYFEQHVPGNISSFLQKFLVYFDIEEVCDSANMPDCHNLLVDVLKEYYKQRFAIFVKFASGDMKKAYDSLSAARVTLTK